MYEKMNIIRKRGCSSAAYLLPGEEVLRRCAELTHGPNIKATTRAFRVGHAAP